MLCSTLFESNTSDDFLPHFILKSSTQREKISGNESINRCFIDSKMCNYICDDPKYEYTSESFDMMKVEKE